MNARWPAAVAAGNVEMSQRITDTLFAALANAGVDVPAQGQGTMNNVTFGGAGWTFYETLGGGQGASVARSGPERRARRHEQHAQHADRVARAVAIPLRIDEYAIRRKTGGEGAARGGDGVVRRYRVLERCTVTLLTERRRRSPRGAAGGAAGSPGRNSLNGKWLPAKCRVEMAPGMCCRSRLPEEVGMGGGVRSLVQRQR